MSIDNQIWNLAEAYISGELPADDVAVLEARLETDLVFATNFQECINLLRSLNGNGKQQRMRAMLADIHQEQMHASAEEEEEIIRTIPLRRHYFRTVAVAASVALLASFSTWTFIHTDKKSTSQYNVLRRELENIKRSQNQIIQNFNKKVQPTVPVSPARYSGSGFALSNNGYFVTNYHVTEGADSVYIQCHNGQYYKSSVIAFDAQADIAILKIDDEDFHLNGEVPYTFSRSKANLGSRVYTLGYPDDQIVYNEGYVSAKNGFQDDSMQYRLELPADPGQSGAPVLDDNGNVLGIVTAKGNQGESNTYAVSSKALLQFINHLPKSDLHLPKTNKLARLPREQQIKKIEYYTCSVKVYKK